MSPAPKRRERLLSTGHERIVDLELGLEKLASQSRLPLRRFRAGRSEDVDHPVDDLLRARGVWCGIRDVHDVGAHPRPDAELGEQLADCRVAAQHPEERSCRIRPTQDCKPDAVDLDDRVVRRTSPLRRRSYYEAVPVERKSTRLNSSHRTISYAVFCLKKKKR